MQASFCLCCSKTRAACQCVPVNEPPFHSAPSAHSSRSPCPALNVLANYSVLYVYPPCSVDTYSPSLMIMDVTLLLSTHHWSPGILSHLPSIDHPAERWRHLYAGGSTCACRRGQRTFPTST